MRPHLEDHAAGTLDGEVPQAYRARQHLDLCSVCGGLVSSRYNGAHPRCRPAARRAAAPIVGGGAPAFAGPSLETACATSIPVLRHVPKAARAAWAQCLSRALGQVASTNSMQAWRDLFMLPKAVLRPAPRGGRRHRLQAAQFTQRRCARWLAGEREELWEAPPSTRRQRTEEMDDEEARSARQSRCCALAAEGELSRACAALTSPPLLNNTGDVVAKLQAKHPRAAPARPALVALGLPALAAVPELGVEDVARAIRSFSRGSAAGPSGLRGDHQQEALASCHGDELTVHLAEVVKLLVRGEALPDIAPHLAGAALHALPKGADDVRPIAVGETLRRLTAKCLCYDVREPAKEWLCPLQVGVATRNGTEAIVHTVRRWVQRHAGQPDHVLLKIDFSNAFNTVDRAALLRETRLRLPGLSPWAEWCYGHHSRLLFQGTALSSEAGVQQGDPLGPLLFALALQPALLAAGSGPAALRPPLVVAYLDDVCMAGTYQQVSAGLVRLTAAARQVGLQVNPAKCELVACGGGQASVDLSSFPHGMPFNKTSAFSLLGAPIGNAAFCNEFTATERVNKALPLLEELAVLGDAQTTLLLLRQCASYCRMVFSTRVTPPSGLDPALQAFDTAVRGCLEAGCSGPLTPEAWMQACLSTRSGGLGLRSVARHSAAGYTASLMATTALCTDIDAAYDADLTAAMHQVNLALPAADHFQVPPPHPLRQQELSRALDRVVVAQLGAPGQEREAYRAHFQLLQQEGAGAWLHAVPNSALGLHVVTPLFRTMVRLRLRLPVADSDMACPLCDGTSDSFGDHARVCPCGGDRVKRHNQLRNILAGRARAAGLQPEVEKPNLLPPRPELHGGAEDGSQHRGNGRRPADVWVGNWNLHGPAAFDVAVTSGLRQGHVANSALDGSKACMDYEVRKCSHLDTSAACATEGLQFVPLVVEACSGGWGPTALKTWRSLAAAIAARTSESSAKELQHLLQALGIALQRENARAILRRLEWCVLLGLRLWATSLIFLGMKHELTPAPCGRGSSQSATWVLTGQGPRPPVRAFAFSATPCCLCSFPFSL